VILGLAVLIFLRSISPSGAQGLAIGLSADTVSFTVGAASYAVADNCILRTDPVSGAQRYRCFVPFLAYGQKQARHFVTACDGGGTCTEPALEVAVECTCDPPGEGCPGDLFRDPPLNTPTNLTATAVSDSQIDLTWDGTSCNGEIIIERALFPDGPWVEIHRTGP